MIRIATAPLALALFALAACGSQDGASKPASAVEGKAAPAGSTWSQQVVATPDGGMLMGNPDAPIKIMEFGSYTCSHCAAFSAESHEPLERDYVNSGKVSFEFRSFMGNPIDIAMTLLARCAGPEAYFPITQQLFLNQHETIKQIQADESAYEGAMAAPPAERFVRLAEAAGLIEFAKQRGLPEDKARQCLADVKTVQTLADGVERDTAKYNITGTPTLIMNEQRLDVTTWPALVELLKNAGA